MLFGSIWRLDSILLDIGSERLRDSMLLRNSSRSVFRLAHPFIICNSR
jgi:hypothetical protein